MIDGAHASVLQVVVLLVGAPLCFILARGIWAWGIAALSASASFVMACAVFIQVATGGALTYHLGGWEPPWGIEYKIDSLGALMILLVSGIGTLVILGSRASVEREIGASRMDLFYTAFLLCMAGAVGIIATGDAFNLFVFLEINSLASYTLIAMGMDRRSLTSSFQYLIMGTIGATFIVIGIGFLYMMTGTLNMEDISIRLHEVENHRTIEAAFAFLIVGISLKLALFPLHLWLPNAYTFAPSVVSVFLASTATKVAVYVLIRFIYSVFGSDYSHNHMPFNTILAFLSVIAILIPSFSALYQTHAKRLLAYSSLAQIGYITLGISLATIPGLNASLLHIFTHAITKGALFMSLACIATGLGSCKLHNMAGVSRLMPWSSAAFLIAGLSLIGLPLTSGFFSKWYLLQAILEQGEWWLALVVVLGSMLAAFYVWKVVETMYLRPVAAERAEVREAPWPMLMTTWILTLLSVAFGVFGQSLLFPWTQKAALMLFGAG